MQGDGARTFVEEFAARLEPVDLQYGLADWSLNTTGEDRFKEELAECCVRMMELYSDPEEYRRLEGYYADRHLLDDALLRRQVELLYYSFTAHRFEPHEIEAIAGLEADVRRIFNAARGQIDGAPVTNNDITRIMRCSTDSAERRAAWEASKEVGPLVADKVLHLVRMRNAAARRLGFSDYYRMQLELQEVGVDWLFATLDRLRDVTEEPFAHRKAELDARIAATMGCSPDELRPWHYADPFFQERPDVAEVKLDPLFEGRDIEALTLTTFEGLGFEIRDIVDRSDLYERSGKHQHAFCINIGRTGDVRVLCNLRSTALWMATNLHEFGHAVYDKYLDYDLPYLLRSPAHANSTEAVAMLMGRLAGQPRWLAEVLGVGAAEAARIGIQLHAQLSLGMLISVRWCLVMTHFERDLYENPDRADLNSLWWDYVERFQLVPRPEGRDLPDWAAKVHLALAPVYYHNYVIGELTASQLQDRIDAEEIGGLVMNGAAGDYLRDRLFRLGASLPWASAIERVTGEPLNPDYFISQFINAS